MAHRFVESGLAAPHDYRLDFLFSGHDLAGRTRSLFAQLLPLGSGHRLHRPLHQSPRSRHGILLHVGQRYIQSRTIGKRLAGNHFSPAPRNLLDFLQLPLPSFLARHLLILLELTLTKYTKIPGRHYNLFRDRRKRVLAFF